MQKRLLLLFIIITKNVASQEQQKVFFGKISDELGALSRVHIINKNNNSVTSSNEDGEFRIFAKPKDTLHFTSVGYKSKIMVLQTSDFGINEKQIKLQAEIIELDEIEIKKHNLIGSIESDIKQTPKNRIEEMVNKLNFNIQNMDYKAIKEMGYGKDELHLRKAPIQMLPNTFQGISLTAESPNFIGIRKKKLRKKIKFKEEFPKKLLSEFGEKFFFETLKIPKEKYYHFLEYCNPLGIEDLYKNRQILKMISIIEQESKSYLKIINEKE